MTTRGSAYRVRTVANPLEMAACSGDHTDATTERERVAAAVGAFSARVAGWPNTVRTFRDPDDAAVRASRPGRSAAPRGSLYRQRPVGERRGLRDCRVPSR